MNELRKDMGVIFQSTSKLLNEAEQAMIEILVADFESKGTLLVIQLVVWLVKWDH